MIKLEPRTECRTLPTLIAERAGQPDPGATSIAAAQERWALLFGTASDFQRPNGMVEATAGVSPGATVG